MNLTRKIAFNTAVQIITKSISVLFTLLTTILLTGYLGKDGYGNYMYLMTLIVLFGSFADWGTATIGVREIAKEEDNSKLIGNIIIIRLLIGLLASLLLVGFAYFLPIKSADLEFTRKSICWAALALFFIANRASLGIIFQAKLQMGRMLVVETVNGLLILLLSWLIITNQIPSSTLIAAVALASFLSLILGWILTIRVVKISLSFNRQFILHYLKESLWMGAILLILTVVNKIDTVMLGILKGGDAVGVYGLAYRVYDVLILGAAYLMNSLLPVISQHADLEINKIKLQTLYQRAFETLILMAGILLIGVWIFAPLIISILTQGRYVEFQEAVPVLRLLSISLCFAYYNHLTGYTIVALGKQRSYFSVAIIALGFNVIANLLFIPVYSFIGSAWITILTEFIVSVLTTNLIFRLIKIKPSWQKLPGSIYLLLKSRGGLI